jgi:hypothetical protein
MGHASSFAYLNSADARNWPLSASPTGIKTSSDVPACGWPLWTPIKSGNQLLIEGIDRFCLIKS